MHNNSQRILFIVLFIASIALILFQRLGYYPINLWDESLYALSALEMSENGNYLVKYMEGKPDMWVTKPPLLLWLQVFFMKIFGYHEVSIRLPSALGILSMILVLFYWFKRKYNSYIPGAVFGLITVTSVGITEIHVARTGSIDALLTALLTLFAVSFFFYSESGLRDRKWFYRSIAFLILASLAKGIAGLMLLPGGFIYLLYKKQIGSLLLKKSTYIGIGFYVLIIGGYYVAREIATPGYLEAVYIHELGGRYLETIEGHKHPFLWYIDMLTSTRFTPYIFFLPLAGLFAMSSGFLKSKNIATYSLILFVTYLLVISVSETKLYWYVAPLIPLGAIVLAFGFTELYYQIKTKLVDKPLKNSVAFPALFVLTVFIFPYYETFKRIDNFRLEWHDIMYGKMLWVAKKDNPHLKEITLILPDYKNWSIDFYDYLFEEKFGYEIKEMFEVQDLSKGEICINCRDDFRKTIHDQYEINVLNTSHNCKLFEVIKKR